MRASVGKRQARRAFVAAVAVACTGGWSGPGRDRRLFRARRRQGSAVPAHAAGLHRCRAVLRLVAGAARLSLADRYNQFVAKFATVLRDNARVLAAHFSHHGGLTASTVDDPARQCRRPGRATDPTYCTHLWVDLDTVLTVEARQRDRLRRRHSPGRRIDAGLRRAQARRRGVEQRRQELTAVLPASSRIHARGDQHFNSIDGRSRDDAVNAIAFTASPK